MLRKIVIWFAAVVGVAAQEKQQLWKSADGVWSIVYPPKWTAALDGEGALNISTPDGEGAVTISCYVSPSGDADKLYRVIPKLTAPWKSVTREEKSEAGFSGEFVDLAESPPRRVLVRAKHIKKHFVLITANDLDSRFEKFRPQYERIIASFSWRAPE